MSRPVFLVAALAATPVAAQDAPTLWDILSPELLIQRALQSGIMAARTQVDIQYGDMAVNPILGQVAITDLSVWPLPEWDENADCVIEADRLVLRTAAIDDAGRYRIKAQFSNVTASDVCVPPDMAVPYQMSGLQSLSLPRATIDLNYDIPSAGADVHIYAHIADLAAIDVTADFAYLWFDGRYDMDDPDPVMFLSHASVTLENLGGWNALQAMAPPPFTDPQSGPGLIAATLGNALAGANREAAEEEAEQQSESNGDGANGGTFGEAAPSGEDPSALTDAQNALIDSVQSAAEAFLANPTKIVVETGFDRSESVFLDPEYYEDVPLAMIEDLQPVFGQATVFTREVLPADLLNAALGENATSLSAEDRLIAGQALVYGEGAPRNIQAGLGLLSGLAEAGNSDAALALADAFHGRNNEDAYLWALRAGAAGADGAASLLDQIEGVLPFARVLEIQAEVLGATSHPIEALESLATVRQEADMRMSGIGRGRSYQTAALWAMIAAAAGDTEAAGILDDIDEIVRIAGGDAQAAWATQEQASADLALQVWIGQNLPARYSGAN